MLQGLKALAADPSTSVIVLISKPPSPEVAHKVLEAASSAGKAVVVNFLGADPNLIRGGNLYPAETLEDAARNMGDAHIASVTSERALEVASQRLEAARAA